MIQSQSKWATPVAVFITSGFILLGFYLFVFRTDHPEVCPMPHIFTSREVVRISAEMNGTLVELPVTDRFEVSKEFHAEVCRYFSGQLRKWNIIDESIMYKFKLGEVHVDLQGGVHHDLAFYTAGKGVIGFSIGRCYYLAESEMDDGGFLLLFVLEKARQAVGAKPKE